MLPVRHIYVNSKRKQYKPIPLGDGKFCYSGPTCKIHSSSNNVPVENKASQNIAETLLQGKLTVFKQEEQEWLCSQPVSLPSLEGKQSLLLDHGSAARWCKLHNTYHVYNVMSLTNTVIRKTRVALSQELLNTLREQQLPLTDLDMLNHYISAKIYHEPPGVVDDLNQLRNLNPEHYDKVKERLAEEKKRYQSAPQGGSYEPQPKIKEQLLLPENAIPDKIIYEFWTCSRKRKYGSQEEANTAKTVIDGTTHVYLCKNCSHYHLGHGDGKGSVQATIKKARHMWHRFPEKANEIVKRYQLDEK